MCSSHLPFLLALIIITIAPSLLHPHSITLAMLQYVNKEGIEATQEHFYYAINMATSIGRNNPHTHIYIYIYIYIFILFGLFFFYDASSSST